MSTKLTLKIPNHIYQQAEQIAQSQQRPVIDIFQEAITELFPPVAIHPQRAQMEEEQAAFANMLPDLLRQYKEQYVAVYQGKVIDHDQDQMALAVRIQTDHPDKIILIKKVTAEPDKVLYSRSPRLLR
jgi:hypothetical protein